MSLQEITLGWLSTRPSIVVRNGALVITTGRLQKWMTLFADLRTLVINPSERQLQYSRRHFYFSKTTLQCGFDEISHLDYEFSSLGTDWGTTSEWFGRHDQLERFAISLVLKDDRRYPLCSFSGEGSASTGWIGVLLGDDSVIDLAGTQEQESRVVAKALGAVLGVPLSKPYVSDEMFVRCPQCGQSTTRLKEKCLYCGQAL